MLPRAVVLLTVLATSGALAKGAVGVIRYRPPPDESERPLPVELFVAPQGSDYTLRVAFDKLPWGEQCQMRCADATIFLDTDDNRRTGLDLGPHARETGADLAITVVGVRQYREHSAEALLKVRVTRLSNVRSVGEGELLAELDPRHDADRVQSDGPRVSARIDATDAMIPSGKRMRVVYHPPGHVALETVTAGMLASGRTHPIQVLHSGLEVRPARRNREGTDR